MVPNIAITDDETAASPSPSLSITFSRNGRVPLIPQQRQLWNPASIIKNHLSRSLTLQALRQMHSRKAVASCQEESKYYYF
jgi:hypothetical protein